ncbi:MAG: serine/threonine-protein kinase, partial [Deltaproteobacteria bacterium]
ALLAYRQIREIDFKDVENRIRQLQKDTPGEEDSRYFPVEDKGLSESFLRSRKRVGRYQLIEKLGKGTTGLVYKGSDPRLNRLVAIKIIRFSDDFEEEMIDDMRERFLREAEIAGRLSHPGIVTIYDVGEDEDLTYMAMEYLEGKSLIRYGSKERRLPLTKVLDVAAKVADALDYAHKQGVIHRDIKPANIMLLRDGNIKVTDFGIAKAISSTRTKTGVILGTPNYMSPEQIMGHKIDARTDIFSLGVLLFQLLTGKLPFRGENLSGLLYHITQGKHPSIRLMESGIPKACEQIIDKALAKNPRDRFRTAGQMARYLTMLLEKINEITKKKESAATSASPPVERKVS